ncbi:hypothetical protein BH23CHL2_BH23CHL2_22000 [soil metagenome]
MTIFTGDTAGAATTGRATIQITPTVCSIIAREIRTIAGMPVDGVL